MEYKKYLVQWVDICSSGSEWRSVEDALDWSGGETSIVFQLGFLLDEDENFLTLVDSILLHESDPLVGTVTRIPVGAVLKKTEIIIIG